MKTLAPGFYSGTSSGYAQVLKAEKVSEVTYYTRGFKLISKTTNGENVFYLYDGGSSVRALTDESGAVGVAASTVFTILFIQECREIGSGFYSLIFPVYLFIDSLSNLVFRRIREGKRCYFSLTKVIVLFFVIYFFFHGIGTDRIYYGSFMYLVCAYVGVIFFSVIIFLFTVRLRAGRISKIRSAYGKQGRKTI